MGRIIGIDLGTTNSCVAVMENGESVVIQNAEGQRTTPSMVAFTGKGERLVGQPAKNQMVTNPDHTIYSIKRFMGRRGNEVDVEVDMVPYKVDTSEKTAPVKVLVDDKKYTPPEISAAILQKMKETAESLSRRDRRAGRHHGSRLLQRRPASGHQGRRQDRRT
jgi:molecular chaperone DnaK